MKQERKLTKKEKDFYIDPENGRERNETKKKRGRGVTGTKRRKQGGIFVPATPNSQLQRRYEKEIKREVSKSKW